MSGTRAANPLSADLPPFRLNPDLACREPGINPEIFFPVTSDKTRMAKARAVSKAKRVCRRCPLTDRCLAWALETRQRHGIWGGKTAGERREILKKRGTA